MLEMMAAGKAKKPLVLQGDLNLGYYGFVPANEFIRGDELATALGFLDGQPINPDAGWLKFAYYGKTLYVAKKPIRMFYSWYHAYRYGCVYGDDTIGTAPFGQAVVQSTKITIKDKQYRVRLMKIMPSDPSASDVSGREHKDLWTRIMKDAPAGELPRWDNFTADDLGGAGMGNGTLCWGQEVTNGSPDFRGTFGATFNERQVQNAGSNQYYNGWRPVLELID